MKINLKARKAKRKLQEIARKTAEDVGYELGEIPRRTPSQLFGKDDTSQSGEEGKPRQSPIIEAMQQSSKDREDEQSKSKKLKFIKDKTKVEEEIEKYRKKREELKKHWEENQKNEVGEEDIKSKPGQPLEVPQSKLSRGKYHPGKRKSAEKRLGKK
jgi:hypothetical protein